MVCRGFDGFLHGHLEPSPSRCGSAKLLGPGGVAWGMGAGGASDGLNNWDLCPRLAVRCRLPGIAAGNRLGSCLWPFRCGATGSLAVLAGLYAHDGGQLDRREGATRATRRDHRSRDDPGKRMNNPGRPKLGASRRALVTPGSGGMFNR
jgi:hypothetical protein